MSRMSGNDRDRQVKNVRSPIGLNGFLNRDAFVHFSGDFIRKQWYTTMAHDTSTRKQNRTHPKGAGSEWIPGVLAALFGHSFLFYTCHIIYVCVIMHCTSRGPYTLHTIILCIAYGACRRLFQHNNTNKTKRRARVRCRRTRYRMKTVTGRSRSIGFPHQPREIDLPRRLWPARCTPWSLQPAL